MKKMIALLLALLLCLGLSLPAFAGTTRTLSKEEKIIGEQLYAEAKNDFDSGLALANSYLSKANEASSAKYSEDAVDVRFNTRTQQFAAVISVQWWWRINGQLNVHYDYYAYTGSYKNGNVTVDTSNKIESNEIAQFWKENWKESESPAFSAQSLSKEITEDQIFELLGKPVQESVSENYDYWLYTDVSFCNIFCVNLDFNFHTSDKTLMRVRIWANDDDNSEGVNELLSKLTEINGAPNKTTDSDTTTYEWDNNSTQYKKIDIKNSIVAVELYYDWYEKTGEPAPTPKPTPSPTPTPVKYLNITLIKNNRLCTRDKFTDKWSFEGSYEWGDVKKFVILTWLSPGMLDAKAYYPFVGFKYLEYTGSLLSLTTVNRPVTEFYAVVDNQRFSFKGITTRYSGGEKFGFLEAGTTFREFLKSLASAKEVAFKFVYQNDNGYNQAVTIDKVSLKNLRDLIEVGTVLEKANLWDMDKETLDKNDITYKASVEKIK